MMALGSPGCLSGAAWEFPLRPAARWSGDDASLQLAPLPLGEPTPDAEPFIVPERVFEALGLDVAARADALGLAGRTALLGKDLSGVGLRARPPLLPLRRVAEQVSDLAIHIRCLLSHAG